MICVVSQMQKIEKNYISVERMACRAKNNVLGRKETLKKVGKQSDMQWCREVKCIQKLILFCILKEAGHLSLQYDKVLSSP